jgi:GT2 family glycosyltransferase
VPLASVIVVCWNAEDVIGRCLEHLLAQDHPNYEVIVVDDASTDATLATAESVRAAPGELEIVRNARNRGCPAARNVGLRHARGEIVAFIDADGFATPDWLRRLTASFDGDPTIGGVASTVFFDDNPLVLNGAGGTVNQQGWAADLSMNESYETAQIASEALYAMGCGMAFRRDAIDRVGPFDDAMLNYYDDVDYGMRVWRAGYRVTVAPDAWVDHGLGAAGTSAARKRLWCERHRMRVVLKLAPAGLLGRWAAQELRSMRESPMSVRKQKLEAIFWNVVHLPGALAQRRRLRRLAPAPKRLFDGSWGDAFPAGVPPRSTPVPERAGPSVDAGDPASEAQLPHGWFPIERVAERSYRWATAHAASLISLRAPARRLRLDYAHVPVDIGGVDLEIRRAGSEDPLAVVWRTRLHWQYIARSIENHPLELPPGDYEVVFSVAEGWLEPPLKTRSLAFALAEMSFEADFDVPPGGLDLSAPGESQLLRGWFELEPSPSGDYRWSSARAAAVVRVAEETSGVRLRYRMTPGPSGPVSVSLVPVDAQRAAASWQILWRAGDWREDIFAARLAPGDYVVEFDVAETWSNPDAANAELPPENRALGLALAALSFV